MVMHCKDGICTEEISPQIPAKKASVGTPTPLVQECKQQTEKDPHF